MSYEKLSFRDHESLSYLQHDKSHIMSNWAKLDALENALKYYSEKAPDLYRGLYPREVSNVIGDLKVGKTFSFERYTSFSEKKEIGIMFGQKTKSVMHLEGGFGFNYAKYSISVLEDLKKQDPKEYWSIDGDYLIEGLEEEKEWIMPVETEYKILKFETAGNGYTFIKCSMSNSFNEIKKLQKIAGIRYRK